MKKKLLLVFVTTIIVFGLMVGCAAPAVPTPVAENASDSATQPVVDETDKEKLSILYLQHWAPVLMKLFIKKQWSGGKENVEIQFDLIVEKDFEFKIANAVENKSGPDVLMRTTSPILYQDSLVNITDIADELIARDGEFFPASKAQSYTGSAYVTLPLYSVVPIWFYRIDELKKANVEFPDTYEEFVDFAKKVNRPEENVYAFGTAISRSRDGILFTQAILWAFGSKVTDVDGKTVTF